MTSTKITRTIKVEDNKEIHVHIQLSEAEIRRLLLPHVASAFASELQRQTWQPCILSNRTTTLFPGKRQESVEV